MEWPIARGINGDEKVEIQILAHNRSTFIKDLHNSSTFIKYLYNRSTFIKKSIFK